MLTALQHSGTISNSIRQLPHRIGCFCILPHPRRIPGLLTHREKYLDLSFPEILPCSGHTFLLISGAPEIIAGVAALMKPAIGGCIIAGCFIGIAGTLIPGKFYEVVLCDLTIAAGAAGLAMLQVYIMAQDASGEIFARC